MQFSLQRSFFLLPGYFRPLTNHSLNFAAKLRIGARGLKPEWG
jgi:hypothetical protein